MNTQDTEYEISEECPIQKYYTQISNIIFHLGLSAYEISLYLAIKRTVGKNGKCFKGIRTLAEESGMGKTKVSETIKSLQRNHELLDNQPLIKVTKKSKKDGGKYLIIISNIMPVNMLYFEGKKMSAERTGCPPDGQGVRVAVEVGTPSHIIYNKKEHKKNGPYFSLASLLLEKIKSIHPKFKEPNLLLWSDHIDKMIRLDGRTEEEIRRVIEWVFSNPDPFWSTNILSTEKLRKQFDKLVIQMSQKKPKEVAESQDKKKVDNIQKNKQIAKTIEKKYENSSGISVKSHDYYIAIGTIKRTKNLAYTIAYSENGFRDQVDSILRKLEDL